MRATTTRVRSNGGLRRTNAVITKGTELLGAFRRREERDRFVLGEIGDAELEAHLLFEDGPRRSENVSVFADRNEQRLVFRIAEESLREMLG